MAFVDTVGTHAPSGGNADIQAHARTHAPSGTNPDVHAYKSPVSAYKSPTDTPSGADAHVLQHSVDTNTGHTDVHAHMDQSRPWVAESFEDFCGDGAEGAGGGEGQMVSV